MYKKIKINIPVLILTLCCSVCCSHGVLFCQAISISLPIYKNITVLHENVSITLTISNASTDTIYIPGLYPERFGSLYNLDSAKYFKATASSYHHPDAHITILPGDVFIRLIYVVYEYGYLAIPFPYLPAGDYLFTLEIPYYTLYTDFLPRTNSHLLSANATFRVDRMTDDERVFIDRCKSFFRAGKGNRDYDSLSVMIQRAPSSRIREMLLERIALSSAFEDNDTADSLTVEYISTYPYNPIAHDYVKTYSRMSKKKIFNLSKLLDRDIPVELKNEVIKSIETIRK